MILGSAWVPFSSGDRRHSLFPSLVAPSPQSSPPAPWRFKRECIIGPSQAAGRRHSSTARQGSLWARRALVGSAVISFDSRNCSQMSHRPKQPGRPEQAMLPTATNRDLGSAEPDMHFLLTLRGAGWHFPILYRPNRIRPPGDLSQTDDRRRCLPSNLEFGMGPKGTRKAHAVNCKSLRPLDSSSTTGRPARSG
jgi:hypothetical protein